MVYRLSWTPGRRAAMVMVVFPVLRSCSLVESFTTIGRTLSTERAIHDRALRSRGDQISSRLTTFTQKTRFEMAFFSSPPKNEEVDPGEVEGTSLRIVKYPHPALRADNDEITDQELRDSPEITNLAREMLKVMYAAEGVGLAAPQVGVNKRLMVYNPTGDPKRWLDETILVNPRIVEFSDAVDNEVEGCLSFPDMSGEVTRSKWIKVEALNLKGKPVKKRFKGWEARIFQHEYDHLDGTVYIDRLSDEGRKNLQEHLDRLIEEYGAGGLP